MEAVRIQLLLIPLVSYHCALSQEMYGWGGSSFSSPYGMDYGSNYQIPNYGFQPNNYNYDPFPDDPFKYDTLSSQFENDPCGTYPCDSTQYKPSNSIPQYGTGLPNSAYQHLPVQFVEPVRFVTRPPDHSGNDKTAIIQDKYNFYVFSIGHYQIFFKDLIIFGSAVVFVVFMIISIICVRRKLKKERDINYQLGTSNSSSWRESLSISRNSSSQISYNFPHCEDPDEQLELLNMPYL